MSIVVVGASSNLAQQALARVAETEAPAEFTLVTRNPSKWADRGATIVAGSTADPQLLAAAFEGKERVLLVSGLNIGRASAITGT